MKNKNKRVVHGCAVNIHNVSIGIQGTGELVVVLHGKKKDEGENFSFVLTRENFKELSQTLNVIEKQIKKTENDKGDMLWN
jgi:hypothetical protein